MIIGVLNQKGGVGKTTIAVNVAACLAMRSKRVLLVDADPQGSSLAWSAAREAPPLFSVVGMAKRLSTTAPLQPIRLTAPDVTG